MPVDASFAEWLKREGSKARATDVGAAGFGDGGVSSQITCPFDDAADASAEAARQIAFLAPARVIERLRVGGRRSDLVGSVVTLKDPMCGGYAAGAMVFVIGADEQEDGGGTVLTVIRRLI